MALMKDQPDEYWKQKLTPEQYQALRKKGTETPFSGNHLDEAREGLYVCAACQAPLFKSNTKYESTTPGLLGWPSFSDVAATGAVELIDDDRYGMHRTEVVCTNCGSHLGHLFPDETSPTNKHYCINSVCLAFDPKNNSK
jgi:peptide-methionine (R)-S-oxide reductase